MGKISYLQKSMLISSFNIVLIAIILTFVTYFIQERVILKNIHEQSASYSALAFDLLNPEDIKKANVDYSLDSPHQKRLIHQLNYISSKNADIGQAYIFSTELKNKTYTKAIAMPKNILEFEGLNVFPGTEYQQPLEVVKAIKKVNSTKKIEKTGVYTDRFGTWITVLYPILNEEDKVYAYFGIDMDVGILGKAQKELLVTSSIITLVTLLIVLFIQYFVMNKMLLPVRELFLAINHASEGNGKVQLEENRKGDIGALNKKFNTLVTFKALAEQYQHLLTDNKRQLSYIQEQNKQLINYSKQVEQMTLLEERSRMAREIHDTIGHRLTSFILGLEVIKKVMKNNLLQAEQKINTLSTLTKETLEEVRRSVKSLPAIEIEENNLLKELTKIMDDFKSTTEVEVVLQVIGEQVRLSDEINLVLMRCLQEALTNSVRHGNSSYIGVSLIFNENAVSIQIKDNGIADHKIEFGFGMNGMKARLEEYNGSLDVRKNNDLGFTVICTIPLLAVSSSSEIKIVIVDDQELIRESLSTLLEFEKDFSIVGTASNGTDALKVFKREIPDIILLDIEMPGMNGIEVLKQIKKDFPSIKVLVLTTFTDVEYAKESILYGAEGYLLKSINPVQLANSIRLVYNGGTLLASNLAKTLVNGVSIKEDEENREELIQQYGLTSREMEILVYLVDGLTYSQIAEEINLAKGTVKNYVSSIYSKLEVENRTQAIKKVIDEGIIN